jgi:hypothetical protein
MYVITEISWGYKNWYDDYKSNFWAFAEEELVDQEKLDGHSWEYQKYYWFEIFTGTKSIRNMKYAFVGQK